MKPSPFKSAPNGLGIPRLVPGGKVSAKGFNFLAQMVAASQLVTAAGVRIARTAGGAIVEPLGTNPEVTHPFQVVSLGKVPEGAKKRDDPEAASPFVGKWEFFVNEGFIYGASVGMSSQAEEVAGAGAGSWTSTPDTLGDYYNRPEFARPEVVDAIKDANYIGGTSYSLVSDTLLDNRNQSRFYIPDEPGTYYFVLRYNRAPISDESGRAVAPFDTWAIDWETRADFVARGEMETWIKSGGKLVADGAIYRIPIAVVKIVHEAAEGEENKVGVEVEQLLRSDVFWPKNSLDFLGVGTPTEVQQFQVEVNDDLLRVAKGTILWTVCPFSGGDYSDYQVQGYARRVWVYPSGSLNAGSDADSPWMNDGGTIGLDQGETYGVYIIGNQDAGSGSEYPLGSVSVAVIADGSDAHTKTRPFSGYMGRTWHDLLVLDASINFLDKELTNFNSIRYRIASVSYDGSKWIVDQRLFGPVTISTDLTCKGIKAVGLGYTPSPPQGATHLEDWEGSWSGYTKDGIPASALASSGAATLVEYLPPP